jgi:hypothetical protein
LPQHSAVSACLQQENYSLRGNPARHPSGVTPGISLTRRDDRALGRRTRQRMVSLYEPTPRRPGHPKLVGRVARTRIHVVEMPRGARSADGAPTPHGARRTHGALTHECLTSPEGPTPQTLMTPAGRLVGPSAARATLALHTNRRRQDAATHTSSGLGSKTVAFPACRAIRVARDNDPRRHLTLRGESARSRPAVKNDSRGRSRSGLRVRQRLRCRTTGPWTR